jgi:hypothetical protein
LENFCFIFIDMEVYAASEKWKQMFIFYCNSIIALFASPSCATELFQGMARQT